MGYTSIDFVDARRGCVNPDWYTTPRKEFGSPDASLLRAASQTLTKMCVTYVSKSAVWIVVCETTMWL